ncbi:MAG: ZIP family metal transporter [Candidatus Nanohaloarchaea archaeon]
MSFLIDIFIVFIAGLITDLATGLGALPFFFWKDISDSWIVALWGLAGGIMLSASVFGLIWKGYQYAITNSGLFGAFWKLGLGLSLGAILVELADRFIEHYDHSPKDMAQADFNKLLLILGVLTVHSFPEGVAIGVSFANMGITTIETHALDIFGIGIPLLAVFMTLAISIQNIPEGLAVSIPLKTYGYSRWDMVKYSIFSSVPQPIGAVLAYYFVTLAQQLLVIGFGFAAGAMIFLVYDDMVPEALERGGDLRGHGKKQLIIGLLIGFTAVVPLVFLI